MILEKYHGLGNDYLVFDPKINKMDLNPARIQRICDRNFGAGSDGILYGPVYVDGTVSVRIYNPDGSEAEKSGNGVRIFSKYLRDAGYVTETRFILKTLGGDVEVEYLSESGELMKVLMGRADFQSERIPVRGEPRPVVDEEMTFGDETCRVIHRVTCVSVGNPHCVIPMADISKEKACRLGLLVENADYFPNRINMQLLKVLDRKNIQIEIYERGAGYTLASGSSSCAAASAAHKLGLTDADVTVHMPGGTLRIEIQEDASVYMTGTVNYVGRFGSGAEFDRELAGL